VAAALREAEHLGEHRSAFRHGRSEREDIAFTAHPGTSVTLQLVATTTAYAQPRLGGSITFDAIDVSLPVAAGLAAR
jgi:ABC-2 type transport system ATP-binding protein